jgi:hypothetical protein
MIQHDDHAPSQPCRITASTVTFCPSGTRNGMTRFEDILCGYVCDGTRVRCRRKLPLPPGDFNVRFQTSLYKIHTLNLLTLDPKCGFWHRIWCAIVVDGVGVADMTSESIRYLAVLLLLQSLTSHGASSYVAHPLEQEFEFESCPLIRRASR